ncbi:MAG: hypothetical protein PHV48_07675 [Candidatus Omnitrophica bacterium]|nr:hypothetical protein [Candidatus Omnitrophota bacterium]
MDGAFSEEAIISRYNSDLANDIGNLLNRTLTMVEKYFEGKIPAGAGIKALKDKSVALAGELEKRMPALDFAGALSKIWEVVNTANKLIEDSKPWTLAKEKRTDELRSLLYSLLEGLRIVALSIYPFMPATSKSIMRQLGIEEDPSKMKFSDVNSWGLLKEGTKVNKSAPLFPRIET